MEDVWNVIANTGKYRLLGRMISIGMILMPAGTYDLILMDIQIPKMNGYKATENIRKLSDMDKAKIAIVAMTANAFAEDVQRCLDAGMNAHIAKSRWL